VWEIAENSDICLFLMGSVQMSLLQMGRSRQAQKMENRVRWKFRPAL
jgi:hypothetical protein